MAELAELENEVDKSMGLPTDREKTGGNINEIRNNERATYERI